MQSPEKSRNSIFLTIFHLLLLMLLAPLISFAQADHKLTVLADFSIPDTFCLNQPVDIINNSQGDSAWYWRICTGNAVTNPNGIDLGTLSGPLNAPWGVAMVQDGLKCFAFVTNSGDSTITRVYWENGLKNLPVAVNLGNLGILTKDIFGIQVKNDNGNWFGFVTNGLSLVRLDFGNSLLNPSPVATKVVSAMDKARGLVIEKDGNDWVGFSTNWPAKTIARYHWRSSLSVIPNVDNLGNLGALTDPMQPALIRDNTGWYLFIANTTSLSQLHFNSSLLDYPDAINLGNLVWLTDDRGLCLLKECNNAYGLIVNHNTVDNLLLQLHFKDGLAGTKAITPLGAVANMYQPSALSDAIVIGDTIYVLALNENSLTMLFFPPCSDLPISWFAVQNPPPVPFSNPGTYTVSLTVNPGLTTEQRICKEVEIVTPVPFTLGKDTTICEGTYLLLTPGTIYKTYRWNTTETSQAIHVTQKGVYSVTVTNYNDCALADTIRVDVVGNLSATVDTSICWGQNYMAGGRLQSATGTYYDTLVVANGCERITTTYLRVKAKVAVNIGRDTCLTSGDSMDLRAIVDNASDITWQDGSHDTFYKVTDPGNYWVTATVNKCVGSDTVHIKKCPVAIPFFLPNAFTPNGDGLNDSFGASVTNLADFYMIIYNRWGQVLFETNSSGQGWDGKYNNDYCESGNYVYVVTYRNPDNADETIKATGSVTLVR